MNENTSCSSCSKENYKTIPLTRIFDKLNEFFSKNDLSAVGRLLDYWEGEALALGDMRGLLEILNEKVGYYRRTAEKEKALSAVNSAFELIEQKEIGDPVSVGTVYLNCATTMKAFGQAERAMPYYEKAKEIYESRLEPNDYKMAALYNNMSSAYKDLGDYIRAEEACYKAIEILKQNEDCRGEIAVTLINIAHIYHDQDPFDERIYELMDKAWDLLKSDKNTLDGDFAFLCSKCYPSFEFFGCFEKGAELKALTKRIYEGN
ncbi:MAG: tetratricopeptide repeat protein [Ruminococcaceae bacterium]|nr:tetratricopeptide repeat protein [Oscillospiraceae bacterium]